MFIKFSLCQVTNPVEIPKIPEAASRRNKWGPTPGFDAYGLELLTHKEPKIRLGGGITSCTIELRVPSGVQLSYQFLREPDEDNRDYVIQTKDAENPLVVRYQVHYHHNYCAGLTTQQMIVTVVT
jgi:hypothetical protein